MFGAVGSVCRGNNLLLDAAAAHDDLEALVIVDARTEIADPDLCAKVREALRDPDVALAGPVGARDVGPIAWWQGEVSSAPVVHRYYEHGGGEMDGYGWAPVGAPLGEVDALYGFAARAVAVGGPHAALRRGAEHRPRLRRRRLPAGARGRSQGRHGADLRAIHHRPLELIEDLEVWIEGHIDVAGSGTAAGPGARPTNPTGSAAPAAPRPSARRRGRWPTRARCGSTPRCSRSSARWRR